MASHYSLSNQRTPRLGSTPGLSPQTIQPGAGSSLVTAQINPNAGQVQFSPANIPNAVQDVTAESTLKFMNTTANAALEYQDRESTYNANEASMAFESLVFDSFSGYEQEGKYVKGFSDKVGKDAVDSYQGYIDKMDSIFMSSLEGLEPSVRQKAMFKMSDTKNRYRNSAAKHRSKQFQAAEEEQRNELLREYTKKVFSDPYGFNDVNKLTNTSLKEDFFMKFPSKEEASVAWGSLMKETTESIFFDSVSKAEANPATAGIATELGYSAAQTYFDNIASKELSDDPKSQNTIRNNLSTWKARSIRERNSTNTLKLKQAESDRKSTYNNTDQMLVGMHLRKEIPSKELLNQLQAGGFMDPDKALNYTELFYGETDRLSDPDTVRDYYYQILEGDMPLMGYYTDRDLGPTGRAFLFETEKEMMDPDFASKIKEGIPSVRSMFEVPSYKKMLNPSAYANAEELAVRQYRQYIRSGMGVEEALGKVREQFRTKPTPAKVLPTLKDGSSPTTKDALRKSYEALKANKDNMTGAEYNLELGIITEYTRAYKEAEQQKANSDSNAR